MYCKLFASLYQGTLRGRSNEILVFTNLLAHTSKDGTVDKHFRAIAEETGLSMDEVKEAIKVLESPDPESRSPEEGGSRITRMDEHRVWGWRIVNYGKYRAIRSEEDRAEQNRLAQQRWREKNKPENKQSKPRSAASKQDKPKEREREKVEVIPPAAVADDEKSDHSIFIELWTAQYPKHHAGEEYAFQGGKDGSAVKALLISSKKTPAELMRVAVAAWTKLDGFLRQSSASLANFNSKFNEIRNELNQGRNGIARPPAAALPSSADRYGAPD